jgi:Bacterial Ig-like domain (group 3)
MRKSFLALAAIFALPGAGQSQPGRILSTTTLDVIECNVDGSNCFTVAGHWDNATSSQPSVAANGSIAFTSNTDIDTTYLYHPYIFAMNADGTNVRNITSSLPGASSNCCYNLNPAISPDASMVAFLAAINAAPDGSHQQEIYLVNADGSSLRQLTPFMANPNTNPPIGDYSQSYMTGLAWNPGSSTLAFRGTVYSSQCGTYGGQPIFVTVIGSINADGTNMQILACDNNDGYVSSIDWSPDGTLIAWGRNVSHGAQGCSGCVGEPAIAFLDLSGQGRYSQGIPSSQLTTDSCQGGPHCIHFSPDSTRLAYADAYPNNGNPCQASCYVSFINLDGSGQTNSTIPTAGQTVWWAPGAAIPAPAQLTLAGSVPGVPANPVEIWPGSPQQLVPTLSDSNGNLIFHSAATYPIGTDGAGHYACLSAGPYGLAFYTRDYNTGTVYATNAGLTSSAIAYTCWSSAPCTFALGSAGTNIPAGGGTGTVTLTADPGSTGSTCPWSSVPGASWITITSGANSSGNGSVNFSVAANSGAARQGAITIAGLTYTVNQDASVAGSTTTTISAPPITYGASGAVTVSVTSSSGTVTGTVTLSVDGGAPLSQTLTGGSTTFTIVAPAGGTHSLSANYAAQGSFGASSANGTLLVNQAPPTVSFTGAPSSEPYQSTFTVAATTNASTTATITAGGACSIAGTTVTMTSGTGTCSLSANWAADSNYLAATASQSTAASKIAPGVTFTGAPASDGYQSTFTVAATTNASTAATITAAGACSIAGNTVTITATTGTCSLTATWASDSNYLAASATQSTTATKGNPAVTFTGAPAAAVYDSTFTIASTTNASTKPSYTGTPGICSISGTTVTMRSGTGTCTLTATWAADSNYNAATATQTTTAVKASTNATITAYRPNPSVVGQAVAVSVSAAPVAPATTSPSGKVTVSDGVGDTCIAALSSGNGSCNIGVSAAGVQILTAIYGGDTNFNTSTSAGASQTVTMASTTTTITPRPATSVTGQPVTVRFTVAPVSPGKGTPTGNVTVSDGAGGACSATVATGSCVITFATAGSKTLTGSYGGDTNFLASTSATTTHLVNPGATKTAITSQPPKPSVAGQSVTFAFTVVSVSPASGTPTGTVTVSDPAGDSCTATVATGNCTITFATSANKSVTASYAGDTNFASSKSTPVTQPVIDFSISAPGMKTVKAGSQTTISVTVAPKNGFAGTVALSCSAPAGITCSLSPASVTLSAGMSATSTATVGSGTKGTYTLTFTGVFGSGAPASGGLTQSTIVTLSVD